MYLCNPLHTIMLVYIYIYLCVCIRSFTHYLIFFFFCNIMYIYIYTLYGFICLESTLLAAFSPPSCCLLLGALSLEELKSIKIIRAARLLKLKLGSSLGPLDSLDGEKVGDCHDELKKFLRCPAS